MSWTLGDIDTDLVDSLQADEYYDQVKRYRAINLGHQDLVAFCRCNPQVYQVKGGTVVGQKEYSLPDDFLYIEEVTCDGVPLKQITQHLYLQTGGEKMTLQGQPFRYFIRGNKWLVVQPADAESGKSLMIYYQQNPVDLVKSTDELIIPRVFSKAIRHFSKYYLLSYDVPLEGTNAPQAAAEQYAMYKTTRAEANFQLNENTLNRAVRRK